MIRAELIPPATDPLAALAARLPGILASALKRALEDGLAASRAAMGPGGSGPRSRTGRLARSLYTRVSVRGDEVLGELGSSSFIAGVQEHGAVIQAKAAKYLKFQVQGRWVAVRRVVIPARPFLRPGRDAALAALEKRIHQGLEAVE